VHDKENKSSRPWHRAKRTLSYIKYPQLQNPPQKQQTTYPQRFDDERTNTNSSIEKKKKKKKPHTHTYIQSKKLEKSFQEAAETPPKKRTDKKPEHSNTVLQRDVGILRIDCVQDALITDLALGGQADKATDIRIGRRWALPSSHITLSFVVATFCSSSRLLQALSPSTCTNFLLRS
jgi:hypothetical protein